MTITSYPFDNQDTSESQYSKLFRELQDTGVVGSADDNTFAVTSDGSGLDVQVASGLAIVRGHAVNSDAQTALTLAAAPASGQRIDRIVLRLDPTANSITLVVLAGTASGVPTAPALTQTDTGIYEMSLAQILVGTNMVNLPQANITDERPWVGNRVRAWSTAKRPASPRKAMLGYNTTTLAWEFWDGTQWTDLIPAPTPGGVVAQGRLVSTAMRGFSGTGTKTITIPVGSATSAANAGVMGNSGGAVVAVGRSSGQSYGNGGQTNTGFGATPNAFLSLPDVTGIPLSSGTCPYVRDAYVDALGTSIVLVMGASGAMADAATSDLTITWRAYR